MKRKHQSTTKHALMFAIARGCFADATETSQQVCLSEIAIYFGTKPGVQGRRRE